MELSFTPLAVVAAVALAAPLVLALTRLPLPAVVLEIVLGIAIGPQFLGWAHVDEPVQVMSLLGLAFLLLLAGLEVDFERIRGRLLRVTAAAYAVSFGIALVIGAGLREADLIRSPLLVAIMLSATGLGIVLPILKDAGALETRFGQVVVAGASIAEVAPIVLLSLFFSGETGGLGAKLVLLAGFALFVLAVALTALGLQRSMRLSAVLVALQDTTAEIRVRAAFFLLAVFAALASALGLEAILGAFLAGATLKLVDRDAAMTHPLFHRKLEAAGFGVFVPFFFVATGMRLDIDGLFASGSTLTRVPLFLAALLAIRALPALLYRPFAERGGQLVAAGLLQATSLSLLVVAGQIGVDMDLIRPANYTALVAAGLLSVILFPLIALRLLRGSPAGAAGRSRASSAPLPSRP
jgi:Kef-type K+ transport system membrane component KefB